ncbi:MAG TPA: glycosyltransferase family 4 protein [Armatimonadota bacterium]|nr:glycosyltransferase family 4 protein [Armatimonadota bacterium]
MRRVLILSNLYPSRQRPTRGTFNLQGFRALARFCEVRVAAPEPWWTRIRRPSELLAPSHELDSGLPAYFPTYWSLPRAPQLHAAGMERSLGPFLTRLRREFPFDIILAAWAYPDGVAAERLSRRFGCPAVLMVLGSDVNELAQHRALGDQIGHSLRSAAGVITVSRALRERVVRMGVPASQVTVQHNGVDGERFTIREAGPVRTGLGLPAAARLITYVGNLVHEKGVDLLVEAMAHLRDRPDTHLVLVGDGPLLPALRARAEALGVANKVQFAGRRLHPEIPDWISAADVLCLPSRREGCPNVVLEALASGRPVVAAAVGGVPELLRGDTGVLVRPEAPELLAVALREALDRSWEPERLRASVPCLSWDEFGRAIHDVLEGAIRARSSSAPLQSPEHRAARSSAL